MEKARRRAAVHPHANLQTTKVDPTEMQQLAARSLATVPVDPAEMRKFVADSIADAETRPLPFKRGLGSSRNGLRVADILRGRPTDVMSPLEIARIGRPTCVSGELHVAMPFPPIPTYEILAFPERGIATEVMPPLSRSSLARRLVMYVSSYFRPVTSTKKKRAR